MVRVILAFWSGPAVEVNFGPPGRVLATQGEKVKLFEQIRREYEVGVGTIAGVSRKLGVPRRMVREALHSAEPAPVRAQQRRLPACR